MRTEIRKLTKEGEEELLSHYRVAFNSEGEERGHVPVIDVRDGITYRMLAMETIKRSHRSKHINYGEYQISRKQKTNI